MSGAADCSILPTSSCRVERTPLSIQHGWQLPTLNGRETRSRRTTKQAYKERRKKSRTKRSAGMERGMFMLSTCSVLQESRTAQRPAERVQPAPELPVYHAQHGHRLGEHKVLHVSPRHHKTLDVIHCPQQTYPALCSLLCLTSQANGRVTARSRSNTGSKARACYDKMDAHTNL